MKNAPSWLSWIIATLTAAIAGVFTMMSYSHNTFTTTKESKFIEESFSNRLDRIEDKIDRILEKGN